MLRTILLCGAVAMVGTAGAAAASDTDSRIAKAERGLQAHVKIAGQSDPSYTIEERMRYYKVPGLSVAVIDQGKILWARGYGKLQAGGDAKVTPETLFQAGSISKPVAAVGALTLVQEGKLSLDANVNDYLQGWRVPDNQFTATEKVTLRRILSHNAGLTVHGFGGYAAGEQRPTVIQVLNGEKPANSAPVVVDVLPGSISRYSGGGYTIMQKLIQDVSGVPFVELLRQRVLAPMQMTSSTYQQPLPEALARRAATGHEQGDTPVTGKWHIYPELAAAGLWTTPSDLAHWVIGMQHAYHGQSKVLNQTTTRQMMTAQFKEWGLGVVLNGEGKDRTFSHGGRNEGFVANVWGSLEGGRGVAVMTNGTSNGLLQEVDASIRNAYGWPVDIKRIERSLGKPAPGLLDGAAGNYALKEAGAPPVMVKRDGDKLRLAIGGMSEMVLLPEGGNVFFDADSGMRVSFQAAPGGSAITGLTIGMGGQEYVAERVK